MIHADRTLFPPVLVMSHLFPVAGTGSRLIPFAAQRLTLKLSLNLYSKL